jgi:hypothetical protein
MILQTEDSMIVNFGFKYLLFLRKFYSIENLGDQWLQSYNKFSFCHFSIVLVTK